MGEHISAAEYIGCIVSQNFNVVVVGGSQKNIRGQSNAACSINIIYFLLPLADEIYLVASDKLFIASQTRKP